MGVITYSFNLNIHLKCHMLCLSVILLCYRITRLSFCDKRFCNKEGALFVLDPVYVTANQHLSQNHRYVPIDISRK